MIGGGWVYIVVELSEQESKVLCEIKRDEKEEWDKKKNNDEGKKKIIKMRARREGGLLAREGRCAVVSFAPGNCHLPRHGLPITILSNIWSINYLFFYFFLEKRNFNFEEVEREEFVKRKKKKKMMGVN